MSRIGLAISGLIGTLLLSGCETAPSNVTLVRPGVPEYSAKVQDAAIMEMQTGACPILSDVMMPDYLRMRDQVRAIK